MDITLPRVAPFGSIGSIGSAGALGAPGGTPSAAELNRALARIQAGDPTTDLRLSPPQSVQSVENTGIGSATTAPSLAPGETPAVERPSVKGVVDSFGAVLAEAMQDLNSQFQAADQDASRLAAGEPVDIHQVMIGMEKANLSFSLALQVRNKLLEAYQEIMRMNV